MTWFADLRAGRTVVHQRVVDLPGMDAHRIETRYRCIDTRHEGRLYNAAADATWCLCGRVVRPGDHGCATTDAERRAELRARRWNAERDAHRGDRTGEEARSFLARTGWAVGS